MLSVFHLDPIRRPAGPVWSISALGNQALQTKLARLAKQVRPDLAALEVADENPFRPPRQQPRQIVLAKVQGQLPQVLTLERQNIEGVELHLIIMPARVQPVEIGDAVDAEHHNLA